ncbi:MAG: ATP-dependent DNA helicase PcrA, partial [Bacilli bacterium]
PDEILESLNENTRPRVGTTAGASNATAPSKFAMPARRQTAQPTRSGAEKSAYGLGDKVAHKKWGTGTVVNVKGTGDAMELDIAFPHPIGIKRLLASFAPIEKV